MSFGIKGGHTPPSSSLVLFNTLEVTYVLPPLIWFLFINFSTSFSFVVSPKANFIVLGFRIDFWLIIGETTIYSSPNLSITILDFEDNRPKNVLPPLIWFLFINFSTSFSFVVSPKANFIVLGFRIDFWLIIGETTIYSSPNLSITILDFEDNRPKWLILLLIPLFFFYYSFFSYRFYVNVSSVNCRYL